MFPDMACIAADRWVVEANEQIAKRSMIVSWSQLPVPDEMAWGSIKNAL
jgi:hypothetical protein